eukprot:7245281-Pyramimonas_sp.AAC.1
MDRTPTGNLSGLPSHLFASDGFLKPCDGPEAAQQSPKRGSRGPQECRKECPRAPQERPKTPCVSLPRGGLT